jgi:hypothetical protein
LTQQERQTVEASLDATQGLGPDGPFPHFRAGVPVFDHREDLEPHQDMVVRVEAQSEANRGVLGVLGLTTCAILNIRVDEAMNASKGMGKTLRRSSRNNKPSGATSASIFGGMQMRNFLLGTLSFALLSAVPLRATIINTTLTPFTGDPAEVLVIADDESNPGFVQLTVELTSPSSGDISALYFFLDIDPFPASLEIAGADVTATALAQGGVSAVGGAFNNMNPFCCFDGGIAFGGAGDDGIIRPSSSAT